MMQYDVWLMVLACPEDVLLLVIYCTYHAMTPVLQLGKKMTLISRKPAPSMGLFA